MQLPLTQQYHTESIMTQAQTQSKAKSKLKHTLPDTLDAIALLTEDHKNVKAMFKEFKKLMQSVGSDNAKDKLVKRICKALTDHAQVEEEIFYPAVRAAIDDADLMDEADVEHAEAKQLISQLEGMKPADDHYDAKVTVLGENIQHHVAEEQDEMFPQAKKAKLNMAELATQILELKKTLNPS
jgi:hemerythrin-like domain-containing protein